MKVYLRDGRQQRIKRPTTNHRDFIQRVISYRTECCVAYNEAVEEGAPIVERGRIRIEYEWALAILTLSRITTDWKTLRRRA